MGTAFLQLLFSIRGNRKHQSSLKTGFIHLSHNAHLQFLIKHATTHTVTHVWGLSCFFTLSLSNQYNLLPFVSFRDLSLSFDLHRTIRLFSRSLVMTSLVSLKSITFHSQSLTLGLCLGTQSAPRSTLPSEGTAREDPRETTSLDVRCNIGSLISMNYI